jgi:hypothetical protein
MAEMVRGKTDSEKGKERMERRNWHEREVKNERAKDGEWEERKEWGGREEVNTG